MGWLRRLPVPTCLPAHPFGSEPSWRHADRPNNIPYRPDPPPRRRPGQGCSPATMARHYASGGWAARLQAITQAAPDCHLEDRQAGHLHLT